LPCFCQPSQTHTHTHTTTTQHKKTILLLNNNNNNNNNKTSTTTKKGEPVPPGERKLYLLIEGPTEQAVKRAKAEVKKGLEESTEKAMRREGGAAGRYAV
jgi:ATP-dependent RNA helicase DDX46/PRP5